MKPKEEVGWWTYGTVTAVLWLILAPTLISLNDTTAVLIGVLLIFIWARWSWYLWMHRLIERIKKGIEDEKK